MHFSKFLILASALTKFSVQAQICNNAAALCSRSYSNITHLGAHDSPFVRTAANSFSIAGNQFYTSLQQLDSGVRLLSAQVHQITGTGLGRWHLCHSLCQLYDAGSLVDWLSGIKGWLDGHPNDVVTILLVNSDNIDASTLSQIYQSAGLVSYSYQPSSTTRATSQWPTLNQMISQNKRLVSFIADLNPTTNQVAPYLLNEFTFVFENDYENIDPSDFSCELSRPSSLNGNTQAAISAGYLPLMNHFRYDNVSGFEIPSVNNANVTNAPSGGAGNLGSAAAECSKLYGKAPTFILTDFSNVGSAIETVDRLNGVQGQTCGRLVLPNSVADSMSNPSPSSSLTCAASATSSASIASAPSRTATGTSTAASASASSAARSANDMHEASFALSFAAICMIAANLL